jgi:hypothetical protein
MFTHDSSLLSLEDFRHGFLAFHWMHSIFSKVNLLVRRKYLKGSVSQDFCLKFFHESSSPKPLKINIRDIFWKIYKDIRNSTCTTGMNYSGKLATGINDTNSTSGKIYHLCQRYWRQICRLYQRHWLQIMGKISDCWHLKVNLQEK